MNNILSYFKQESLFLRNCEHSNELKETLDKIVAIQSAKENQFEIEPILREYFQPEYDNDPINCKYFRNIIH